MSSKKRFGVSIPIQLAEELDKLAKMLSTNRSFIVREALREYISNFNHFMYKHKCYGIFIVSGNVDHDKLFDLIEGWHNIIHSFAHAHLGDKCVEVIFVCGESDKIRKLYEELMSRLGCTVWYISIH